MKKVLDLRSLFVISLLLTAPSALLSQETVLEKSISIKRTTAVPEIDGVIEEIWQQADSVSDFVQNRPYENAQPSERTVAYLMQDDENLYVAFRCYSQKNPPTKSYTKDEDYVLIGIDPMGSRTGGYFFWQYASGIFWDGMYTDDGRSMDLAWEGVWYQAVKVHPDRMDMEFKIPFKTIRYKKGLSEWGLQLRRHIAENFEDDSWVPVPQRDNDLISRWGKLAGIEPRSSGYYFELYPEGFMRNDKFAGLKDQAQPSGSLTMKWDITPQTTLNATAYPDFAQIESDQFSLNLSRYPRYLQEQRPFFVDGQDVFRLSSFGDGGGFSPLNIFYSRAVGRSIGGEAVQIMGGAKLTHKTSAWNLGVLAAMTDQYSDQQLGIAEPQRRFGALRARRRILANSEIGILASGTMVDGGNYNYSSALETVLRSGPNQLIMQGAFSDRSGKTGWAGTAGFRGFTGPLLTMATAEVVNDSFDVSDIGFVPWAGRSKLAIGSGPYWTYKQGALRNLIINLGGTLEKQPGSSQWSKIGSLIINPTFRRNRGGSLELNAGRGYEADTSYLFRSLDLSAWSMLFGNNFNAGCRYAYEYNYNRGYLAYNGSNYMVASYSFISPLSMTLLTNLWMEWDTTKSILASWSVIRPRMDFRITPTMTLSAFNEMVFLAPKTQLTSSQHLSNRMGALFSWNFAPKSWIYIALNDYQAQDLNGFMQPQYTISAVKAKYLLYF
ncbi:MAG: hypothetical protein A2509_09425 [Candidatus Edwardsbacteria bacterium RIFOXYD12_FULL_50_11]|uniref:DUF5916 domain-containing protein n=1 Tax=Candidatus Edwardsbacteria bacterium GWF2_54_11 TaxID=1817851 RepID=A0A1F5R4R3_9BACT|nr:MAG: hypothetical protein A2502_08445 [Candidatus Edwardsbacteria bacterium RifOxyC12_full_54_24]OGF07381.1 MAG: hypothetical protein A2273_02610 [Candidatus Edwardsbacteria bacterium RifOxyA12_full_54_48]OGF09455.1 MAG: hypothetical protein A2024_01700 [Candidatus Edwardsbacteria bacterium GWF2_54_11]OGF09633.1 MAG: hypothetical protein A3K15_09020 [Candidatus Edwardsbacteria bacterium GWE2_54_12]OGF18076.1 MAG: hypothetical protein A2509_09425 [Candidatus Edwardsbacteria bacterium RIFOXYD1